MRSRGSEFHKLSNEREGASEPGVFLSPEGLGVMHSRSSACVVAEASALRLGPLDWSDPRFPPVFLGSKRWATLLRFSMKSDSSRWRAIATSAASRILGTLDGSIEVTVAEDPHRRRDFQPRPCGEDPRSTIDTHLVDLQKGDVQPRSCLIRLSVPEAVQGTDDGPRRVHNRGGSTHPAPMLEPAAS